MGDKENNAARIIKERFYEGAGTVKISTDLDSRELQRALADYALRINDHKQVRVPKEDGGFKFAFELEITDLEGNGPKPATRPARPSSVSRDFTDMFESLFGNNPRTK